MFFSIIVYPRRLYVTVPYSRTLLIYSTGNSLHLPTPHAQSIPLPLHIGSHKSDLYVCESVSVF